MFPPLTLVSGLQQQTIKMSDYVIDDVLKSITKKFGNQVVRNGVPKLQTYGKLSLGSPGLDFCLYNSLIEGKMVEFSGEESSAKTTVAFLVASSYIRAELERRPDNPRHILFVDAECAADPEWALRATGYDMNREDVKTYYVMPTGQSAEQIFDMVIDIVKTGEIGLVIFDSLTAIVPQQIADESMEKKDMGGIAKPLGDFCKKINGLINRYHTTFIGINGLTENISGYGDKLITPGGKTWKRACMVRLRFKRGDFFDVDGNILAKKDAQSPAGHIIEMYVMKTKVCKWDRKLGRTMLSYDRGIDLISDTIDVAILLGLIDNSTQGTFKFIDPDTGEIITDESGAEVKVRGKKNVKPYLEQNPAFYKKLYNKVYELMSVKDDPNVVSFEQALMIDINNKLGVDINDEDN